MKEFIIRFFVLWGIILIVSFVSAENLSAFSRLGYSAIMGMVATVLGGMYSPTQAKSTNGERVKTNIRKSDYRRMRRNIKTIVLYEPGSAKILYRIKESKVYEEWNPTPIYEIKGDKVYRPLSARVVYEIKGDKIHRGMEPAPFLEIKGSRIYKWFGTKPLYVIDEK